jgi:hypothetical protein
LPGCRRERSHCEGNARTTEDTHSVQAIAFSAQIVAGQVLLRSLKPTMRRAPGHNSYPENCENCRKGRIAPLGAKTPCAKQTTPPLFDKNQSKASVVRTEH